ncbi:hypothetical protein [Burkholderia sp. 8Y]|nr:hypothetical protein [Burkholderia sp. 8Y]
MGNTSDELFRPAFCAIERVSLVRTVAVVRIIVNAAEQKRPPPIAQR